MRHIFPAERRRYYYLYLAQFTIPACYLAWLVHPWQVILGTCLLCVFAILYILSAWASYWGLVACTLAEIALMMLLGGILSPGFFATLFWPAAAAAGLRRWHRPAMLAILIIGSLIEIAWLARMHHVSLIPYLPMILSGIFATILTTASVAWGISYMRSRAALKQAEATIERLTKTAERERISQDLHDVMGHELAMIALKSQVARRLLDRDRTRVAAELDDIGNSAKQALARVRAYIADVVTPQLDEEWAAAAKLLQAASIDLVGEAEAPNLPCDPAALTALAMCLREAVTNAVRHSRARKLQLLHGATQSVVWVSIQDDGRGFGRSSRSAASGADASTDVVTPHGLSGMRARLAAVGGKLEIGSNGTWITSEPRVVADLPGSSGTCIRLVVPRLAVASEVVGTKTSVEGLL